MIPQIQVALNGWETPITLIKVSQSFTDYDLVESETQINFQGVIQPFSPETLKAKPEGKRSWQGWQVHTRTNIGLETGDKVIYNDETYEVEEYLDYELNNYFEYHLLKDYE